MATVQVRNVSDGAHAVLRRRAAAAGMSLQEYLRDQLERLAARPTVGEVLERAGGHSGGRVGLAAAAGIVREERDRR